jgi:erythronate-4-phosphate dehydrogenase
MKLLIDDAVFAHEEIFSNFGEVITLPGHDINRDAARDCDVLIVRSRTQVNEALLNGSRVKFVGSTVAGLDHVDEGYLKQNNIAFSSAQGCNANAVAEYVISALANLAVDYDFDLTEKTLGIIGVGNVGSRLDLKAKQLGITTLLNDPPRQASESNCDFVELDEALSADIVSFHTPLTYEGNYPTANLLAKHNFNCIAKNTILINAARGGIIDEEIWQKTQTKANVIDCWKNEPYINSLLQQSAYWATPHIAGHSVDAKFMGSYIIYQTLCHFSNTEMNKEIANLIKPLKITINHNSLQATLNAIYPFIEDDIAIRGISKFEHYRRHYPIRYEWHHFDSSFQLPLSQ